MVMIGGMIIGMVSAERELPRVHQQAHEYVEQMRVRNAAAVEEAQNEVQPRIDAMQEEDIRRVLAEFLRNPPVHNAPPSPST